MNVTDFWQHAHGGSTHFPIALAIASFVFDLLASVARGDAFRRDLRVAAFYAMLLGAAASAGAVISGLALTSWDTRGAGTLARHLQFIWPAFGLLIGLAVWRLVVRDRASRRAFGLYLSACGAVCGLLIGAGYWGAEMLRGR